MFASDRGRAVSSVLTGWQALQVTWRPDDRLAGTSGDLEARYEPQGTQQHRAQLIK